MNADALAVVSRVLLFGAFAYGVTAAHEWKRNRRQRRADWPEVALAAALGASITVIALSEVEYILPGILALGMLVLAQGIFARVRGHGAPRAEPGPLLLLYHGKFSPAALQAAGLSREQLLAGLRERGVDPPSPGDVLILEPSGAVRLFRIGVGGPIHIFPSEQDGDPHLN